MALLIPHIKMPKQCEDCPCAYFTEGAHHDYCQAMGYETEINYGKGSKPDWCPLIEAKEKENN